MIEENPQTKLVNNVLKQFYTNVLSHQESTPRTVGYIFKNSTVAGGAVRDCIFNKLIKDVDIFILNAYYSSLVYKAFFIEKLGFRSLSEPEYDEQDFVVLHSDAYSLPIQIILTKHANITDLLNSFPATISRACYNIVDNKITTSYMFKKGAMDKRILYRKPSCVVERQYIKRLQYKYPPTEWTWEKVRHE